MGVKEIKECRICGNRDLIPIISLGVHALSGIFPEREESDPIDAPLELVKCNDSAGGNCGLLQLKHTVSPEIMYLNNYGYRSGMNRTMTEHLKGIVEDAEAIAKLDEGDVVLDIGSNDATLLKFYSKNGLVRVGIDPTIEQFKEFYPEDYVALSDFFSEENFNKLNLEKKAKVITSIAMFYDLDSPVSFAKEIGNCLDKDGIWILEQSYMPTMLDTNSFDTICHEHLEYYSLKQMKYIADRANLRIVGVSFNDSNGGSFRIVLCHKDSKIATNEEAVKKAFEDERKMRLETLSPYNDFKNRVEEIKINVGKFLTEQKRKGKSIFLYGASTKGNTFLQYLNLGREFITAAADKNPEKWGRRTPRTNIPIISEEKAREVSPDIFLVLPWHFKKEFIEREKNYVGSGGSLLFALPNFEIVSKNPQFDSLNHVSVRKKALITGISGQLGSHLAELLIEKGYKVYGLVRRTSHLEGGRKRIEHLRKDVETYYGDLGDAGSIERVIQEIRPDEVYNLAAQSHVGISFQIPEYTSDVNATGVVRLCEAVKRFHPKCKVYQASTSELYGGIYPYPVNEDVPFYPKSPYGISKLYAYWAIRHYRETYDLFFSNGIVFNSESSRRGENFVTKKITRSIREIMEGKREKITLGNLNARRDWNHAKDTVKAMWLIMQADKPGDYVVASGESHSVKEFVEESFRSIGIEIGWKGKGLDEIGYDKKSGRTYVSVDPSQLRPAEVNVLMGDSSKIRRGLGWSPKYKFKDLVNEMMEQELEGNGFAQLKKDVRLL